VGFDIALSAIPDLTPPTNTSTSPQKAAANSLVKDKPMAISHNHLKLTQAWDSPPNLLSELKNTQNEPISPP